jgi:putative tricarboxylic transport membrane protein
MEYYLDALIAVFHPTSFLLVAIGTVAGVVFGALPGLSGPIGVALLLPFTFNLNPAAGLLMLGGLYMGSCYGGSITGILLNTPGTPEAAPTTLEGFPLAQQGRAKEALYYSILSCTVGGIIGVLTLLFFTPLLAKIALKFGPPEMFLIAMSGLAVVGSLTGREVYKGIFAAAFGVLISTVGPDIMTGTSRMTFGLWDLEGGIPLIPALIGLFAISEMLVQTGRKIDTIVNVPFENIKAMAVGRLLARKWGLLIRSSFLGTFIGILPGTGGAVSSFVAYAEAKRSSKNAALFGKGNVEGIIAAESSNNAAVGGSLVPLLSLGVPGSTTTAVMYGALTIHGLIPGPRLFVHNPDIVYTFMFGMLLTALIMGLIGIYGVPFFSSIIKIRLAYIIPIVLVLCLFGAYSIRNSLFDVFLAICFGLIGYLFRRTNIPPAPTVLGIILGPLAEENFRQVLVIAQAKGINPLLYSFTRPIAVVIFLLLMFLIFASFRGSLSGEGRSK